MGSKKLFITSAAIVVVASVAILAPSIASGVPLAPLFPVSVLSDGPDDRPGNGKGNAFGHGKGSDDFPGKNGQGKGNPHTDDTDDGPGNNGKGNAFGHDKGSDDFPGNSGQGKGNPHNDD